VFNDLGNMDPLMVAAVIDKHLQPPKDCIRTMLADAEKAD
jgi:hypothetical protein